MGADRWSLEAWDLKRDVYVNHGEEPWLIVRWGVDLRRYKHITFLIATEIAVWKIK